MKYFLCALALVFIVLKLCGVIAWSWWLVLLPLWFGFAILAVAGLVYLVALAVATLLGMRTRAKKQAKAKLKKENK